MKENKNSVLKIVVLYLPLAILLLFLLFPFYWTFVTSIKPEQELYGKIVTYWPQSTTFESYRKLFFDFNFLKPMYNSFIVAFITTVLSLSVSVLAAYAF